MLWALLFGNFVIGTGVMLVPGSLNNISSSLKVSLASAGQLITFGAVLMCVGAPLFAAMVGGWDRRKLLERPCCGMACCIQPARWHRAIPAS